MQSIDVLYANENLAYTADFFGTVPEMAIDTATVLEILNCAEFAVTEDLLKEMNTLEVLQFDDEDGYHMTEEVSREVLAHEIKPKHLIRPVMNMWNMVLKDEDSSDVCVPIVLAIANYLGKAGWVDKSAASVYAVTGAILCRLARFEDEELPNGGKRVGAFSWQEKSIGILESCVDEMQKKCAEFSKDATVYLAAGRECEDLAIAYRGMGELKLAAYRNTGVLRHAEDAQDFFVRVKKCYESAKSFYDAAEKHADDSGISAEISKKKASVPAIMSNVYVSISDSYMGVALYNAYEWLTLAVNCAEEWYAVPDEKNSEKNSEQKSETQPKIDVAYFLSAMYGKLSKLAASAENEDEPGEELRGKRMELLQKAADYADVFAGSAENRNVKIAVSSYNELGVALRSQGDNEKASEYLKKAADAAEKCVSLFERAVPLLNLAAFCRSDNDFDGSAKHLAKAIPLLQKYYDESGDVNDGQIYAEALQDYALSLRVSGGDKTGLDSIRAQKKAVELFALVRDNYIKVAAAYVLLARLYAGTGNNKRGFETAEKARAALDEKMAVIDAMRAEPDKNLTDYIADVDALISELKSAYENKETKD